MRILFKFSSKFFSLYNFVQAVQYSNNPKLPFFHLTSLYFTIFQFYLRNVFIQLPHTSSLSNILPIHQFYIYIHNSSFTRNNISTQLRNRTRNFTKAKLYFKPTVTKSPNKFLPVQIQSSEISNWLPPS